MRYMPVKFLSRKAFSTPRPRQFGPPSPTVPDNRYETPQSAQHDSARRLAFVRWVCLHPVHFTEPPHLQRGRGHPSAEPPPEHAERPSRPAAVLLDDLRDGLSVREAVWLVVRLSACVQIASSNHPHLLSSVGRQCPKKHDQGRAKPDKHRRGGGVAGAGVLVWQKQLI